MKSILISFHDVLCSARVQHAEGFAAVCSRRDGLGIGRLMDAGVRVAFYAAKDDVFAHKRAAKMNIPVLGPGDDLSAYEAAVFPEGADVPASFGTMNILRTRASGNHRFRPVANMLLEALNPTVIPATAARSEGMPKALVLDFDGVCTEGVLHLFEDGREGALVNEADFQAIAELHKAGVPVTILSKERSTINKEICEAYGIPAITGIDNKLPVLTSWATQHGLTLADVAYVGDDVNDAECLSNVGFPLCPADAEHLNASIATSTHANGGCGAVREVIKTYFIKMLPPATPAQRLFVQAVAGASVT